MLHSCPGTSPHLLWHGTRPPITKLFTFGQLGTITVNDPKTKRAPRADPAKQMFAHLYEQNSVKSPYFAVSSATKYRFQSLQQIFWPRTSYHILLQSTQSHVPFPTPFPRPETTFRRKDIPNPTPGLLPTTLNWNPSIKTKPSSGTRTNLRKASDRLT